MYVQMQILICLSDFLDQFDSFIKQHQKALLKRSISPILPCLHSQATSTSSNLRQSEVRKISPRRNQLDVDFCVHSNVCSCSNYRIVPGTSNLVGQPFPLTNLGFKSWTEWQNGTKTKSQEHSEFSFMADMVMMTCKIQGVSHEYPC